MSVGRIDSSYIGINQNLLSESTFYDPSYTEINQAFISCFMNYYTTELKISKDKTYNAVAYVYPDFKWDWKRQNSNVSISESSPSTAPDLLDAMSNNPKLKVLVLNGIYDLATPFAGTEYTFDHMGLDKKIKGNIIYKYYEAGHMMYVQNESAAKFKEDVAEFIFGCLK